MMKHKRDRDKISRLDGGNVNLSSFYLLPSFPVSLYAKHLIGRRVSSFSVHDFFSQGSMSKLPICLAVSGHTSHLQEPQHISLGKWSDTRSHSLHGKLIYGVSAAGHLAAGHLAAGHLAAGHLAADNLKQT